MRFEVKCKQLDELGRGICYVQNRKVVCQGLLEGEKALIDVDKNHVSIIEILESSNDRVQFNCPVFSKCGGCQLSIMSYKKECELKTQQMRKLFPNHEVPDILGAQKTKKYRNKVIASFSRGAKGKIIAGQYIANTHHVVSSTMCVYQPDLANQIIKTCCALMEKFKIAPYDEDKKRGYLRHVLIRLSSFDKALVTLVSSVADFPERKRFMSELRKAHPQIETIITNVNTRSNSAVLSEKELIGVGQGYIEDVLCGKKFRISSSTFYQIHHEQTEILYKKAIEMAELKGTERILDAYCGIGTISLIASDHVKEAVGVEINKASIRNAIMNAKLNGVHHCRYLAEDCTQFMLKAAQMKEKFDVVFMDPAREGSTPEFLKALSTLKPEKIIYISCNPETQKRDAAVLKKHGYHIRRVQPVDMFPRTLHVENILLLTQ